MSSNSYCERLGISVPSLAAVRAHREANTFSLMIVALLERGHPMSLADVAKRFKEAAVFETEDDAAASLKRCRPSRPPIYRDGDLYALDPHDDNLDLWVFRLGLRPPKVNVPTSTPPARARPPTSQRLSIDELDEAWQHDANLNNWSAQRVVLAVLDAHGRPMSPDEVIAFVSARTKTHRLVVNATTFRRVSSAIAVADDGTWSIKQDGSELIGARNAVRDAVDTARRYPRRDPEAVMAARREYEKKRDANAAQLAALRRVIVHAFPPQAPEVVVLLDIANHTLTSLTDHAAVATHLAPFDMICGLEIRSTLRKLGIDPETRRVAELGPPQKSVTLGFGRSLKLTPAMFIEGSCGIRRPLTSEATLRGHLAKRRLDKLAACLEADAKSLFALHEYGRLQGSLGVRLGSEEQRFPAPWHYWDEPSIHHLKREAFALKLGLIAVVGLAPAWDSPAAREERLEVRQGHSAYDLVLRDDNGEYVHDYDVQTARLEISVN